MKIAETCSCGASVTVEDCADALQVVADWRDAHRCVPAPWRTDPSGSSNAGTQLGFQATRSEVMA